MKLMCVENLPVSARQNLDTGEGAIVKEGYTARIKIEVEDMSLINVCSACLIIKKRRVFGIATNDIQ